MKRFSRPVWNVNLFFLVGLGFLFLAAVSLAYQNGPPSFAGHTSEEIEFMYTFHTNTCTSNPSTTCTATCPVGSFLVAGFCGSNPASLPTFWTWWGNPESKTSFSCTDLSHSSGEGFSARATCIQGALLP